MNARWMVVAGAAVAALVLVGAALASRTGIAAATRTLARGQAEDLLDDVRRELREAGPPDRDTLARLLAAHADQGLTYLALEGPPSPGSPPELVEAGVRVGPPLPARPPGDRHPPPAPLVVELGARVQMVAPLPPGPGSHRGPGPPPLVILELEPRVTRALTDGATRVLVASGIGAALLLLAGLIGFHRLGVGEREAAARARERHLASLGELSAVLAHEIRNPLASLKGNAQLLAEAAKRVPALQERAGLVVDEALRLELLTEDLLAFARTGLIERRDVDPVALVRRVGEEAAPGRVDVVTEAAPAEWSLDPARLAQVLTNLVRNAAQASPAEARIVVSVGRDGETLLLQVRDRGPGFPAGTEARIFEPFFTTRTRGTGLGLAVAARIVSQHGGTIRAGNHPEGGATVDIRLPRAG